MKTNPNLKSQRDFIFKSRTNFKPVKREEIYDARHIFPQVAKIIDYLKDFEEYSRNGVMFNGGAIFHGHSGTGKTFFARYIASVSGAKFINLREFPVKIKSGKHIWQDEDVTNLCDLGEEWISKNNRPLVFFIDQFDDWIKDHRAVLSQLEVELDGFSGRRCGIFFIITSRLAPAVLAESMGTSIFRRGRIGIHVAFGLPDHRQQVELLKGFLSNCPHDGGIDIENIVYLSTNSTQDDLRSSVDLAFFLAVQECKYRKLKKMKQEFNPQITEEKLIEVFIGNILDSPSGHEPSPEDQMDTAVHETGHGLIARAWGLRVCVMSARPGVSTTGLTFSNNDIPGRSVSFEEMRLNMAVSCGGLEAPRVCGIPETMGSSVDIEILNDLASSLIAYGGYRKKLKKYGLISVSRIIDPSAEYEVMSPKLASRYEKEIRSVIKKEQKRARDTLKFFGKKLILKVAKTLITKPQKIIMQKELDRLLEPKLDQFHKKYKIKDRSKG